MGFVDRLKSWVRPPLETDTSDACEVCGKPAHGTRFSLEPSAIEKLCEGLLASTPPALLMKVCPACFHTEEFKRKVAERVVAHTAPLLKAEETETAPREPASPAMEVLRVIALSRIRDLLRKIEPTRSEVSKVSEVLNSPESVRERLLSPGIAWTPAMRAQLLLVGFQHDEDNYRLLRFFAEAVRGMPQHGVTGGDATLVGAAVDAVLVLCAPDFGDVRNSASLWCLHVLSELSEARGDISAAYDLSLGALGLGPDRAYDERVARRALYLAVLGGKAHQIVVSRVHYAFAIVHAADSDEERRLEAFDACEVAIEQLERAPEHIRHELAEELLKVLGREYLRALSLKVMFVRHPTTRPKELLAAWGTKPWPERITRLPLREWAESLAELQQVRHAELEVDKARIALEPPAPAESAASDWNAWTIDHPAYRRAVPHMRSFLREAHWEDHLLVLTHELTHVYSLLGSIGGALTCLRIAAWDNEIVQWSNFLETGEEAEVEARIREFGAPPLEPGEVGSLFRAEVGLELNLKRKILQDVWAPWFEGLAVFAEVAADPALNLLDINDVTRAMRHIIDFTVDSEITDPAQRKAAYDQYIAEFEQLYGQALAKRGPIRFSSYVRWKDSVYLPGYLAVRAVVSSWRRSTGQPLNATEAFSLLLHATRHGTFEAVPDLSLRSDQFEEHARKRMTDWVASLSAVSKERILDFLVPCGDGPVRIYHWKNGQPVLADENLNEAEVLKSIDDRLRQALSTLTRAEDANRFRTSSAELRRMLPVLSKMMLECVDESFARMEDRIDRYMLEGSLLPIGRAAGRFSLNIDATSGNCQLSVFWRTTEEHHESGQPSFNGMSFSVSMEDARQIEAIYERDANPRMLVTRVIDLSGYFLDEMEVPGTHLLVFSYGDWMQVRLAGADSHVVGEDLTQRQGFQSVLRSRLQPRPLHKHELDAVSPGEVGAKKILDWLRESTSWSIGSDPVDASGWARHVQQLAVSVLDPKARVDRQHKAAYDMLREVYRDEALASRLVNESFEELTAGASEYRSMLISALMRTATRPDSSASIGEVAEVLGGAGLSIFENSTAGWDVRPVLQGAAS